MKREGGGGGGGKVKLTAKFFFENEKHFGGGFVRRLISFTPRGDLMRESAIEIELSVAAKDTHSELVEGDFVSLLLKISLNIKYASILLMDFLWNEQTHHFSE